MNIPKLVVLSALVFFLPRPGQAQFSVHQPTLMETNRRTAEVSTQELREILANKSATVLDVRPYAEYAMSHIPGAINVALKPGTPKSLYVSDVREIERLVSGNKSAPLILYCNGPHCGKSKRTAEELLAAGFTNVRRYQVGIPVWRALGEVTQTELGGAQAILERDRTAVFVDIREPEEFQKGTLPGARNIPVSRVDGRKDSGEVRRAKDDGRLPMEDHNTRILVFGGTERDGAFVAQAVAHEAFHNVSYFAGSFERLRVVLETPSEIAGQKVIFVTRHAEQGEGENPGLTPTGEKRAKALARVLSASGIDAIYSTDAIRTIETAQPLSELLRIPVATIPRTESARLVERLRGQHSTGEILVVGHSQTIPGLLKDLGVATQVKIQKQDYGNLFVVIPSPGGAVLLILKYPSEF